MRSAGARHEARGLAEEVRRDEVAASPRREELDELGVGRRDQDDRERGRDREEDREMRVVPEREERLFRAVRRGRETVRSEAHPREEGHERKLVEYLRIEGIPALAEEDPLRQFPDRHDSIEYTGRSGGPRTLQSSLDGRAPGKIRRSPLRRLLRRPQAPPCRERWRRRVRIRARDPRAGRHAAAPARRQGRGRPGPDGHGQDGRVPDRDLRAPRTHEASEAVAHTRGRSPSPRRASSRSRSRRTRRRSATSSSRRSSPSSEASTTSSSATSSGRAATS